MTSYQMGRKDVKERGKKAIGEGRKRRLMATYDKKKKIADEEKRKIRIIAHDKKKKTA